MIKRSKMKMASVVLAMAVMSSVFPASAMGDELEAETIEAVGTQEETADSEAAPEAEAAAAAESAAPETPETEEYVTFMNLNEVQLEDEQVWFDSANMSVAAEEAEDGAGVAVPSAADDTPGLLYQEKLSNGKLPNKITALNIAEKSGTVTVIKGSKIQLPPLAEGKAKDIVEITGTDDKNKPLMKVNNKGALSAKGIGTATVKYKTAKGAVITQKFNIVMPLLGAAQPRLIYTYVSAANRAGYMPYIHDPASFAAVYKGDSAKGQKISHSSDTTVVIGLDPASRINLSACDVYINKDKVTLAPGEGKWVEKVYVRKWTSGLIHYTQKTTFIDWVWVERSADGTYVMVRPTDQSSSKYKTQTGTININVKYLNKSYKSSVKITR